MSVSGIGQRAFGGIVGKVNGSAAGNETIYDLNFVLSGNLTQYIPRPNCNLACQPKGEPSIQSEYALQSGNIL